MMDRHPAEQILWMLFAYAAKGEGPQISDATLDHVAPCLFYVDPKTAANDDGLEVLKLV